MAGKKQKQTNKPKQGQKAQLKLPAPMSENRANTAENRAARSMLNATKGPNNKYINTTINAIALQPTITAPGLYCLNAVAQGTSENTRIGRLARMNWIDLDLDCFLTQSNSPAFYGVRLYIVAESTALGSALAPAQFFVDNTNFGHTSQRDRTNRNPSRYVVLWDSGPFALGNVVASASGTTVWATNPGTAPTDRMFSFHLPLGFSTDYSRGNAGTIADIDTNSLYLMAVSDAASTVVQIDGSFTLCFTDDKSSI